MEKQVIFTEPDTEAGAMLSDFFGSDGLLDLFYSLYHRLKKEFPDAVIRGKPGEIFGVSRRNEKYLFYAARSSEGILEIRFKGFPGKNVFSAENEGILLICIEDEICRRINEPEDYLMKSGQPAENRTASKNIKSEDPSETPFYIRFGVEPSNYRNEAFFEDLFPVNLKNRLCRAEISTLERLLNTSPAILIHKPNIGRASLNEIEQRLNELFINTQSDSTVQAESSENSKKSVVSLKEEKKEFHDWLMQLKDGEIIAAGKEAQQDFLEKLKALTLEQIQCELGIDDRIRDILIRRFVLGEMLLEIGIDFQITRERVRQIVDSGVRKLKSLERKHPDPYKTDFFHQISDLFHSLDESMVYSYLNYVHRGNRPLLQFVFSCFCESKEANNLIKEIIKTTSIRSISEAGKTRPFPDPIPIGKRCPRCGSELLLCTVQKGQDRGKKYISCPNFPACWYNIPLSDDHLPDELPSLQDW